MKKGFKLLSVLSLTALGGALVLGATAKNGIAREVKATDYETAIEMSSSFFANWSAVETALGHVPGYFKGTDATYWNEDNSYNALGTFFDGCNNADTKKSTGEHEGDIYTLSSRRWRQDHTRPNIYFQWGGARDVKTDDVYLERLVFNFYATENGALVTSRDMVNDTFSSLTMVLRNYIVPDDVLDMFKDENQNRVDFYMSVDLVDGRTDNYGAHTFGYLHVNQTLQEVADAQWLYYRNCVATSGDNGRTVEQLRSNYWLNGSLKAGFENSFEEDFEDSDVFQANFMLDAGYDKNGGDRHLDKAISSANYRTDPSNTNMPFNKTGNKFFKGWYGSNDGEASGYVEGDSPVYRFVSKPFHLPSNGIVSIKMANKASLHVIDFDGGHGDLAWVDCKTNNPGESTNIAKDGVNAVTMVRHVINLSRYAGRLVQLAIADVEAGGWGAAYFDELKANYTTVPALKVDVVEQVAGGVTSYSALNDVYVSSVEGLAGVESFDYVNNGDNPAEDTSPLLNASKFVKSYMNLFRNNHETNRYCSVYKTQDAKDLLDTYKGLSEAEQRLVCASKDYHRKNATAENWWTIAPTFDLENGSAEAKTLGYSIAFLARENGTAGVTVYGAVLSSIMINSVIDMTNPSVIVGFVGLVTLIALLVFFATKKRKAE